ncbi:CoA transferase [Brevundimonas sp.]|uniref:CaiB/BaiF CoA transferase family protein n=1 Tax=Brevundimonas sp. TaxID=1871086 RepID=UPI0019AF2C4B|nr:CoA transferase [Brevundimonas sp.]MBD3836707.1 CoA transferase [Brevundimonas sp.]
MTEVAATGRKPLEGYRVLDLTNVLAGPFCAYQFAMLGAEVIKVETPGTGDLARVLGADPALTGQLMGASFLAQNAGKRSITINLKHEAGKAVLRRLVETADVLVENFRPGVMERLGVGHEALKGVNPRLIYCAISGFGQDGPMRGSPAYDQIIQGLSGVMSITGDSESAPLRVGYPVADSIGGMTAAFAIAAALAGRERSGEGAFIDVSMLESTIATMGWVVSNYLIAGQQPEPIGNDNFTAAPSGAFRTADGLLNIAANKQEQFEALAGLIGRPDLVEDARFARREDRKRHRQDLTIEIERALAIDTSAVWEARLNAAGVPAGRVLSVPEALDLPQVRGRGLVHTFEAGEALDRPLPVALSGYRFEGAARDLPCPPPRLGQHTDDILADAGFSPFEVAELKQAGAV